MSENKDVKNKITIAGVVIPVLLTTVFFVLLYLCNVTVYFMMDDEWYRTNLVTGQWVSSVHDIIESQVWHYQNWGGRSVAHTILQFLLWAGQNVSDIANTIVFAVLALILTLNRKKISIHAYLIVCSLIVACNPTIRETLFWQSGTCNYLYMALIYMSYTAFILASLDKRLNEDYKANIAFEIILAVLMIPWGLLAGWTNENIGPVMVLVPIVSIIVLFIKKKKVPVWMFVSIITSAIGCAAMILAPGNSVRSEQIESSGNIKIDLCKRFFDFTRPGFEWLWSIVAITLLSYFAYRLVTKKRTDIITNIILGAGVLSYMAFVASPHIPERSMFGIMCFFIWASVRMIAAALEHAANTKTSDLVSEGEKANGIRPVKINSIVNLLTVIIAMDAILKLFYFFAIMKGWYR